jgi:DNA helicase-2/ATP-dependent DNA helicase PcrA
MADHEGLEEERRLMYVAITRARKRLYLSYSQTRLLHGQTRYNVRSRFFDELPEHAVKWLTPKHQGFAGAGLGQGSGFGGGFVQRGGYGGGYEGGGFSGGQGRSWQVGSQTGSRGADSDRFASPPVPARKAEPAHGLRVGMQVFHNKFGEGALLALEGAGDDARAQVKFGRHGVKWLALSVAKLTPVP